MTDVANAETRMSGTILVVDDEPAVRGLVRTVLETAGCRVLEAGSGEEAMDLYRRHADAIDLMLTDEVMPGLSGSRLADLVFRAQPEIGIVIMSGYIADEHARDHILDGRYGFLSKPFALKDLINQVRGAASGRRCA